MFLSKYKKTNGKYGPIYNVTRGINVRKTHEGKWLVVTQKYRIRRSKTFGNDRNAFKEALNYAESQNEILFKKEPNPTSTNFVHHFMNKVKRLVISVY